MLHIILISLIYFVSGAALWRNLKKKDSDKSVVFLLGVIALAARVIAAALCRGHSTDMYCFSSWADLMYEHGAGGFYSLDAFTDYPPGYMYVLWFLGGLKHAFNIPESVFNLILKLPAIFCDIITAALLYRFAEKHTTRGRALAVCALWLFNPTVFLNSAVWGQVDAVFSLLTLITVLLVTENKLTASFFVFAAAITVKPQALFYTPILLFAVVERTVYPEFKPKELVKYIGQGALAVLFAAAIAMPFGLSNVIRQYIGTLSSYKYFSVNAYNLWSALGLNWVELSSAGSAVSTVMIVLTVLAAGVLFFKIKNEGKYLWLSGFICFSVFVLSCKMHERYGFPAMLFLLAGLVAIPTKANFRAYFAVSITQFINTAYVLFYGDSSVYFTSAQPFVAQIMGFAALAAFAAVVYAAVKMCGAQISVHRQETILFGRDYNITRADVAIVAAVTAVYAAIALFNLGDMRAPEKGITLENETVSYIFADNDGISGMKLYIGTPHLSKNNTLSVKINGAGGDTLYEEELENGSVFCWNEYELETEEAASVTFTAKGRVMLLEAAFSDKRGALLGAKGEPFDEQELVPDRPTYKNGTYFDEIYHARTAYEFIHGIDVYEWTHPPLGKVIISLGIRACGMNPFGWRIAGTLVGIMMVPVMFAFAKKLFGKTEIAAFAAVLFTFDFMHFAQTRIATIDVYITFFIMLMYLCILCWLREDFYSKRSLLPLGLSGIFFGLGAASKWTGLYAGAGLAVLFFGRVIAQYRNRQDNYAKTVVRYILFCIAFFVIIPVGIYAASYIPFMKANGIGVKGVWQNQLDMFGYHSGIEATHSFASEWYKWPIMYRPIWYYSGTVSDMVKEGISSFGNPLVWWVGIPAFFYTAYTAIAKRDKNAVFLAVGYLAQYLPWIPVTRITFIYHYFPCVPFVALMIGYSADRLLEGNRHSRKILISYAAAAVVLFAMFYPVLSGYPVSVDYVRHFLKWSKEWVLVSGA